MPTAFQSQKSKKLLNKGCIFLNFGKSYQSFCQYKHKFSYQKFCLVQNFCTAKACTLYRNRFQHEHSNIFCNFFLVKNQAGFSIYLSPKIRGFQIDFKIGTKIRILTLCVLCILNSRLEKIEAAKLPLWVDYGQYTTQVLTTHEHNWH